MKNLSDYICDNCGAHVELHHYEDKQCPLNGKEAEWTEQQRWQDTKFVSQLERWLRSNSRTMLKLIEQQHEALMKVRQHGLREFEDGFVLDNYGWIVGKVSEAISAYEKLFEK